MSMQLPAHGRYPYSTIGARRDYAWPEGKRLALYFVISLEHFAFGAGFGEDISTLGAPQTHRNFAWRDYGLRIGLWRLLRVFDELRIPVAFAVNSLLYRHRPELIERLRQRGDEIIAHGRTSSELPYEAWEGDEARMIREVTNAIAAQGSDRPTGWHSPGFAETRVTPDLLKEAGYAYILDWPADDQPFWLETRAGAILSLPYSLELDDVTAVLHRHHTGREFARMVATQIDVMLDQCRAQPLACGIGIHPYVTGQPFRLRPLRRALESILAHGARERLWLTRPGEVARHCLTLLH